MKHARYDYDRIQDPAMLIPKDEPVFLLRAQDTCAAAAVDFWANMAGNSGVHPAMVRLARQQANRMANWRKHKTPDLLLKPDFSQGGNTVNDEQRSQTEAERQEAERQTEEQPRAEPEPADTEPGEGVPEEGPPAGEEAPKRSEVDEDPADDQGAEPPDRGQTQHEPESPTEGGA